MSSSCPALFGPEFEADPYPAYRWLREHSPVHRVDLPGGTWAWLVTDYALAKRALADARLAKDPGKACKPWQLAGLGLPFDHRPTLARHMLNADAPDHQRLRRAVSGAFQTRRIEPLRARTAQVTEELLDRVAGNGHADLIADLAYPLPITIICDLIGVPESDRAEFHRWAAVIDSAAAEAADDVWVATDALEGYLVGLVADRGRSPDDDLLSELIEQERAGVITADELRSTLFLLLVAGHETTVALIGNAMLTLLRDPEELARAAADPSRLPAVVEEVLRYAGPVRNATWRFATEDVRLGDVTIGPGEPVLVSLLAANRDPAAFGEPERFDPDRPRRGNEHLAFGLGPHFCIGSGLARMEAEIAISAVLRRFPGLALAVPPDQLRWWPSPIMRGLFALPVRWGTPQQ
ncbi:cytochrome P450 family protein [Allokutzneria oryzae]|uniref:cytochrome P450 family protein n=1 Tax=Allokutzneria oryzae TaxID=1378989 RepID=UPI00366DEB03